MRVVTYLTELLLALYLAAGLAWSALDAAFADDGARAVVAYSPAVAPLPMVRP